jgi:hypothetical protein
VDCTLLTPQERKERLKKETPEERKKREEEEKKQKEEEEKKKKEEKEKKEKAGMVTLTDDGKRADGKKAEKLEEVFPIKGTENLLARYPDLNQVG